jgi:hypothetical protein
MRATRCTTSIVANQKSKIENEIWPAESQIAAGSSQVEWVRLRPAVTKTKRCVRDSGEHRLSACSCRQPCRQRFWQTHFRDSARIPRLGKLPRPAGWQPALPSIHSPPLFHSAVAAFALRCAPKRTSKMMASELPTRSAFQIFFECARFPLRFERDGGLDPPWPVLRSMRTRASIVLEWFV